MQNIHQTCFFRCWLVILLAISIAAKGNDLDSDGVVSGFGIVQSSMGLQVQDGWYVHNGSVVWGNAQHNGWWRAGQRPNLTRNALGQIRPNRTEDLVKLTDNMLRYGYPGFEHNFGLWYDRRRDAHDTSQRQEKIRSCRHSWNSHGYAAETERPGMDCQNTI